MTFKLFTKTKWWCSLSKLGQSGSMEVFWVSGLWSLESKFPCLPCKSLIPQFQGRSFKVFTWQVQPYSLISWVHPPPGAWYRAQRQEAYIYFMPAVAERLRRAYPAPLGWAGVGSIPANPRRMKRVSFLRWRFEMKLSPFFLMMVKLVCVSS